MTLSFIRSFFMLISGLVGYYIGMLQNEALLGAQIGCLGGLLLIFIDSQLKNVSVRGLSSMVFGLLLGIMLGKLLSSILGLLPLSAFILSVSELVLIIVFSYIGAVMALRGKDEFNIIIPYVQFKRQELSDAIILLDTSVLIDGRIPDIAKTHFLMGSLVVPRSVLLELQALADSENDVKRQRGRRGMELVRTMQKDSQIEIKIHEDEFDKEMGVDSKLIMLSRTMDARLCTTDYNLGRLASLQGIEVLNINELAKSVKSSIFVGDDLNIALIKEGKEPNQAVGYLEDGTMVVVIDAKKHIGKEIPVTISSVLQTQAGRLVFAKESKGKFGF